MLGDATRVTRVWLAIILPIIALFIIFPPPFSLLAPSADYVLSWTYIKHLAVGHTPKHIQASHQVVARSAPVTFTRRIVAVGDLHGDMENARKVLRMADVVDANGHWTGHVDIFVQTGDIIDRGIDTIALFEWMDELRKQAHAKGGQVILLLGNHEYLNLNGDWRYVTRGEIATFGNSANRKWALYKGIIGKSWAEHYVVAARLPLHPSLGPPNTDYHPSSHDSSLSHAALAFVHGGLPPGYPDLVPFPSRINKLGALLLHNLQQAKPPVSPPSEIPPLPAGSTKEEEIFYGENGPLWYRGWASDPESKICKEVDDILERTGTKRMIMGHTVHKEGIVSKCGGKIIIIDTGISRAYGGRLSALSIKYTLTPVHTLYSNSKPFYKSWRNLKLRPASKHWWNEHEVVTALYEGDHKVLADIERKVQGDFYVK